MIFKVIELTSIRATDLDTEIKFAIASSRADNIELLRFDIKREEEEFLKSYNSAIRVLKRMKAAGQIQFFATPTSFSNSNPEAAFLINKYPAYMDNIPVISDMEAYVYIKL